MRKLLEGLEGALCHLNDVLVMGKEHDTRLTKVCEQIESAELTLNAAKSKASVKFLGRGGFRTSTKVGAQVNNYARKILATPTLLKPPTLLPQTR